KTVDTAEPRPNPVSDLVAKGPYRSFSNESTPLPAPYDPFRVGELEMAGSEEDVAFDGPQPKTERFASDRRGRDEAPGSGSPDPGGAAGGPPAAPLPVGARERVCAHLEIARRSFERGDVASAAAAASEAFACDPQGLGSAAREAERPLLLRIFEAQLGSLK